VDRWKTITGIGAVGLIALIAFLFWQVSNLKDDRSAKLQEINDLQWQIATQKASLDTLRNIGEYSKLDTIWPKTPSPIIIYRDSLKVDTIPGFIPNIRGVVSFDTTKYFGGSSNPLSVRVTGQIHYPDEFKDRNWLLIVPEWQKPPISPSKTGSDSYSLGVGIQFLTPLRADFSLQGSFKRVYATGSHQIGGKGWGIGLGYEILRF